MSLRRKRELGELERAVLDRLWSAGPADVKAVHSDVGAPRGITANTVQSTLERLRRKGIAERRKQGRAYIYTARVTRREWLAGAIESWLQAGPGVPAEALVAAFVDVVERASEADLEALERELRARRRRREGER